MSISDYLLLNDIDKAIEKATSASEYVDIIAYIKFHQLVCSDFGTHIDLEDLINKAIKEAVTAEEKLAIEAHLKLSDARRCDLLYWALFKASYAKAVEIMKRASDPEEKLDDTLGIDGNMRNKLNNIKEHALQRACNVGDAHEVTALASYNKELGLNQEKILEIARRKTDQNTFTRMWIWRMTKNPDDLCAAIIDSQSTDDFLQIFGILPGDHPQREAMTLSAYDAAKTPEELIRVYKITGLECALKEALEQFAE
jgi:hypothetical protein